MPSSQWHKYYTSPVGAPPIALFDLLSELSSYAKWLPDSDQFKRLPTLIHIPFTRTPNRFPLGAKLADRPTRRRDLVGYGDAPWSRSPTPWSERPRPARWRPWTKAVPPSELGRLQPEAERKHHRQRHHELQIRRTRIPPLSDR
jgi:hypothetical protein